MKLLIYLALICCLLITGALWLADKRYPLRQIDKLQAATVVLDRHGEPLRFFADAKGIWRYQVNAQDVSPHYLQALINYEDRYFYQHPGVNPFSLLRAVWQYIYYGEVVSGGSTLTMQVARLLHPSPRTVGGKLQQILRALQLEWHLSKEQILTIYLNQAPFGGTIEGVQAASLQYLRKPASKLRYSEAALLAVLPQAPSRLRPDRFPARAQGYRDKVLDRLQAYEIWEADVVARAKQESVTAWAITAPMHAPIFSRQLKLSYPNKRVIRSTLDLRLQSQIEKRVKAYVAQQAEGVSAAVLLIDNQTQEVLAYVGSADFFDATRAGHVDMVQAIRSPGSTLKPFLFGLALDANLIHSESLLADSPRLAVQYRPGNFHQGFSGPVSAAQALQRSLNLPFVQLITHYGAQNFANKLTHVQTPLQIPAARANPAIILGGAGSSLERLVTLYTGLANDGDIAPVKKLMSSEKLEGALNAKRKLLSSEAAWITWNTLAQVSAPNRFDHGVSATYLPEVAWKTGTSWGYRDVWAIGVSDKYTLGVWLGRPDGSPMDKTMGRVLAGPLLFQLFNVVDRKITGVAKPDGVIKKSICWPDGRVQGGEDQACDQAFVAETIRGFTPKTLNPEYPKEAQQFFHPKRSFLVDKKMGLRVSRDCSVNSPQQLSANVWPKAVEPWLRLAWQRDARIPPFDPVCKTILQNNGLLRVHGIHANQVFHTNGLARITVDLAVDGQEGRLFWYLNGQLLKGDKPEQTLWLEAQTDYQLFVQSETGSSAQFAFKVL